MPTSAAEALRRALPVRPVQTSADAVPTRRSRHALLAMAHRLDVSRTRLELDHPRYRSMLERLDAEQLARDLQAAADLARAAAAHGWPTPALESLGHQAQAVPTARTTDPATSKAAGEVARAEPNTRNQLGRLLMAWERLGPATSEEAAQEAGVSLSSEYAKRASDLQALGYLRPARDEDGHEVTRPGRSGRHRMVLWLTEDGAELARRLRAEWARS